MLESLTSVSSHFFSVVEHGNGRTGGVFFPLFLLYSKRRCMLGLNTLCESRQVSLKGYMIICSLFSLLPASPRPSWRGADTAKPRQDFLSSAMPSGRLRRVPSPRHPPSPKNNGQRLLLVCYFGSCRGRAEWKIVSPGALGAFQLRQRPARLSAPGLRRPRAFRSSRVVLGGTEGLEANVALLRGERRGMESLGGVSGVAAPQ